jgi:hypothetical protein
MAADQIRNTSDASELDILLSSITDPSERKAVTEAFYDFAKGNPYGFSVRFAMLIKAHTLAIQNANKLNGKGRAPDLNLEQLAKLSKLMTELRAGQEHIERRTEVLFALRIPKKKSRQKMESPFRVDQSGFKRPGLS